MGKDKKKLKGAKCLGCGGVGSTDGGEVECLECKGTGRVSASKK